MSTMPVRELAGKLWRIGAVRGVAALALGAYVLSQPVTSPVAIARASAAYWTVDGLIALWAAVTVRQQGTLVYLIALAVFLAGIGRLISMAKVGLPEPHALWLAYVISELVIPCIMVAGQFATRRNA